MLEVEILAFVGSLENVAVLTASEEGGAPQVAWGDSFFYYVPPGEEPNYQQQPFATLVRGDYPDSDVESQLDRPGVFRVNIAVGRDRYRHLLGHLTTDHQQHHGDYDYARADVIVPHPVYAEQGWVSIVNPGPHTAVQVLELLGYAVELATDRDKRRQRTGSDSQD